MPFDGAGLSVRVATADDLPEVAGILDEVSLWQRGTGFPDPWPVPFPVDRLRPGADQQAIHLVADRGPEPVATFTLVWDDPSFWGVRPPDAGYLHKIAVRRSSAGRGVGRWLIEWAAARVRERGRRFLRLDTLTENVRLHAYYRSLGFTIVGRAVANGLECSLFERPLAVRRDDDRPTSSFSVPR